MSRKRGKLKRSPSKERRLEQRAQKRVRERRQWALIEEPVFRYLMNLRWAQEREAGLYEWDAGVVCETCWLEQPYEARSTCNSEGLLGIPCAGTLFVTHEHYRELS